VEGSKFCLFSVIMPAKYVSGISPRFHYRRLAFCFLPLASILESPPYFQLSQPSKYLLLLAFFKTFNCCLLTFCSIFMLLGYHP
jgi:hypothetical protein